MYPRRIDGLVEAVLEPQANGLVRILGVGLPAELDGACVGWSVDEVARVGLRLF
jgi:hypothetical protein